MKNKVQISSRASERGSVIIWIFVAAAMFGALSFVVAQMMQGGSLEKDRTELDRIFATDIMQYSAVLQRAVRFMKIDGLEETDICFDSDLWSHNDYEFLPACNIETNRIFSPDGGAVTFSEAAQDWFDTSAIGASDFGEWVFSARYEIANVGTDSATAGTVDQNADLIAAIGPIRSGVCEAINRMLNYSDAAPPSTTSGIHAALAANKFDGTYNNGAGRIGDFGRERCVNDPAGYNFYYKLLLAR